jgi:sialate O-acetylesterase
MGLGGCFLDALTPPEGFQYYPPQLKELADEVATWTPTTDAGKTAYFKTIADIKRWSTRAREALYRPGATIGDFPPQPMLPGPPPFVRAPTSQYNACVHRFMPAAVKGVIVQPREFDVGDPHYEARLAALIQGLRDVMHQKDAPFCVVQMHSPHRYERKDDVALEKWMAARQSQTVIMAKLPGVTTIAAYDHDPKYRESLARMLGMRAAQWAVAVVKNDDVKTGPTVKNVRRKDTALEIVFDNIGEGLMAGRRGPYDPDVQPLETKSLHGFEVAAADGTWHEAAATITAAGTVTVTCDGAAKPVAVRYAWSVSPFAANLYNKNGFPALPFCETVE